MLKITAQKAAALEAYGEGRFSVNGRIITFTGNNGKSALWQAPSKSQAEAWVSSWRRVFTRDLGRVEA